MAVAAYTQAEKEASKAPDWEIFYSKGGTGAGSGFGTQGPGPPQPAVVSHSMLVL